MRFRTGAIWLSAALAGMLAAAAPAAAASSGDDQGTKAKQEIAEAYDAVADYTYAKKQQLVVWLEHRNERLTQDAAALREKASNAGTSARRNLVALSDRLETQRKAVSRKLRQLGEASAAAWGDLKRQTLKAYRNLETSYQDAMGGGEKA